jgi:hypothetical protein
MAPTMTTARPGFTDEELVELLGLIRDSDTVELKLTVPESDQRSTVVALGMDPLQAQIRQVFFFDTPQLALSKQGVVVRGRRIQGKGDDAVVKLRPVVPADLPAKLRSLPGFGVEVDAMPGGFVCSGRLKVALDASSVSAAVTGNAPLRKLFSKEQRNLFAEHAPEGIGLDDLSILGPIFVLKLRFQPKQLGRRLVAEMWMYPDGSRLLELSTRCTPADAFEVAAEVRGFLASEGVDLSGEQETKTRKALQYFAGALRKAAADPPARTRSRARSRAGERK